MHCLVPHKGRLVWESAACTLDDHRCSVVACRASKHREVIVSKVHTAGRVLTRVALLEMQLLTTIAAGYGSAGDGRGAV